ncbi:hypothetical protein [Corynebacterium ulcerans]|uniref:hypothetical protein n=1 Tax=Corynebacterium ulcerans TaxID=65058 RepID=UPI00051F8214|nr:hypothetical protein [Corynebacterium ulcerans]AIT89814.1 Hypothetical protein Cul210932_1900 [Corynebacterium ulcerans]ALD95608.1 Hypothetical protein Cul131001_1932 [Corynebacterium ulcerans]SQG55734.1 Uncharacterised protein [Corynebacterium ulcerans]
MAGTITALKLDLPTADQLINAADVAFSNMYAAQERDNSSVADFLVGSFRRIQENLSESFRSAGPLRV